ncbi:MAG: hypothetical protein AUG51_19535 [Acidobacteria bacterium 13_1_20CM_3_53_8]|nr:MAG: hypothetical protein AUG51_19535 [Acidobacteria bacterium 13_1_20CM_3_53_8]
MNNKALSYLPRFLAPALALLLLCANSSAQSTPEPQQDQLLNGLRVLIWNRPGDPNVLIKLRIHSGGAFDTTGKSGLMALLGDALFPDPTTREYFTEELGGRLEVTTDMDAINISLSGHASAYEHMVEILRTALVTTPLTPENVKSMRDARIKLVRETSISPAMMADRAIASRLFGEFPYGRPFPGTPESLARIERADLLFARERFLNPNNATLVVIGGVEKLRAMRALKQLLGNWRRSDTIVPPTFRQPDAPDARMLLIDLPGAENSAEVRLAVRGLTRSDREFAAATLMTIIARDRWQQTMPSLNTLPFYVRNDSHVLPGSFVMGASVSVAQAADTLKAAQNTLRSLVTTPPSPTELAKARSEALAELNKRLEQPAGIAELWLDGDTFKLASIADQIKALSGVTAVEVQGVAVRLFRDAPIATVVVGNASQLRALLEGAGQVEIAGQQPAPAQTPSQTPTTRPTPMRSTPPRPAPSPILPVTRPTNPPGNP